MRARWRDDGVFNGASGVRRRRRRVSSDIHIGHVYLIIRISTRYPCSALRAGRGQLGYGKNEWWMVKGLYSRRPQVCSLCLPATHATCSSTRRVFGCTVHVSLELSRPTLGVFVLMGWLLCTLHGRRVSKMHMAEKRAAAESAFMS